MGQQRDARIENWQQRVGIHAARGHRAETLERISQLAFELIKLVELERSGIRDGDGGWSGCDPLACIIGNLVEAEQRDLQAWKTDAEQQDQAGITLA